jgi:RNA polymerase sigma factor (sigma-70 family)
MQSVLSEDDVMQETYADVFLSFPNLDIKVSFTAWLQQVAKNNLRDAIRCFRAERRGGQRRCPAADREDDGLRLLLDLVTDGGTTASRGAMRHEWQEILQRTLAELPDAYREVLRLYDLEVLDADQVGRRLGCSSGAVYMRRSRALAMLRGLLAGYSHYL